MPPELPEFIRTNGNRQPSRYAKTLQSICPNDLTVLSSLPSASCPTVSQLLTPKFLSLDYSVSAPRIAPSLRSPWRVSIRKRWDFWDQSDKIRGVSFPPRAAPMARWQSGHAADCNSVYAGSIPTLASIFPSLVRHIAASDCETGTISAEHTRDLRPGWWNW